MTEKQKGQQRSFLWVVSTVSLIILMIIMGASRFM